LLAAERVPSSSVRRSEPCLVFSGPPPSRQAPTATVICPISGPAAGGTYSPTQPTTRMRRRLLGGTPPVAGCRAHTTAATHATGSPTTRADANATTWHSRSEEHTSELQSRENLVCRLLLEK